MNYNELNEQELRDILHQISISENGDEAFRYFKVYIVKDEYEPEVEVYFNENEAKKRAKDEWSSIQSIDLWEILSEGKETICVRYKLI